MARFSKQCARVQEPYTVLHTIETSGLGGAERVLLQLAASVDAGRFRSVAAVPSRGPLHDALEASGVRTHVVRSGRWWDPALPRGLARLCRVEGVALIHAHLPDQNFFGCLAGVAARCKTVATYHGELDLRRADTWRGAAKLRLVRSAANAVVAVCDSVREALVARRFRREQVTRIYNGIDVDALSAGPAAGIRRAFGWPDGTRVVGVVANVRVSKGYEHLLRAARLVVDARPDTRVVAAGDIDPALGAPILALQRALELEEHVRFLGFRADVGALLRDLDVFVLPSTSEGFPLALLEAMASGRAVVATRCGGPEEVIDNGHNGLLVPPGDPAALASAILNVLDAESRAAALRLNAQRTARRYTLRAMVADYEALYDRLLA